MGDLKEKIDMVKEFHLRFKIPHNQLPTADVEERLYLLRHKLMQEENDEYLDACKKGDLTEIADALGDKMYILFGTILTHGLQHIIEDVFNEIQESNLSKLDENGQPIYREDGKIMKSNRYFKPDIGAVLKKGSESGK